MNATDNVALRITLRQRCQFRRNGNYASADDDDDGRDDGQGNTAGENGRAREEGGRNSRTSANYTILIYCAILIIKYFFAVVGAP